MKLKSFYKGIILSSFYIYFICNLKAQPIKDEFELRNKHNIGIFFSPDYISAYKSAPVIMGKSISNTTHGAWAYSTGLYINYYLRKNVSVSAGFQYSFKRYTISYEYENAQTAYGEIILENINFYYYEVPVKVKYDLGVLTLSLPAYTPGVPVMFFLSGGIAYNKIDKIKIIDSYNSFPSFTYYNFPPEQNNISWLFGLGANVKIFPKISITINPEFRIFWEPDHRFRQIYSFGINAGLSFNEFHKKLPMTSGDNTIKNINE